jgi:hypothetical protein
MNRRLSVLITPQAHTLLVKLKAKLDTDMNEHHSLTDVVNELITAQAKVHKLSV